MPLRSCMPSAVWYSSRRAIHRVLAAALAAGCVGWLLGGLGLAAAVRGAEPATAPRTVAEVTDPEQQRLLEALEFLASDAQEGRGVGSDGIRRAADYLAGQFEQLGLDTRRVDGEPFQRFTMVTGSELGTPNSLVIEGPPGKDGKPQRFEFKLGTDFNPLAIGGSGKFEAPLVFAGYGITAPKLGYDDYEGLDVEGKCVVVLRHEPQQAIPHSPFDGTQNSSYAPYFRKISNAYEHGAAAVIFVTDAYDIGQRVGDRRKQWKLAVEALVKKHAEFEALKAPTAEEVETFRREVDKLTEAIVSAGQRLQAEFDPLVEFRGAGGSGEKVRLPVFHARRFAMDAVVRAGLDTNLDSLERDIDQDLKPQSRLLEGWTARGQASVRHTEAEVMNVIAVLEGEGPHADETILVGAHYDHLGWGGEGSLAPGVREIHNGADDNASGAAALVEVARLLKERPKKLGRRVVFLAFTGEERGLVGSAHYCRSPVVPLEKTVAMLNMDMVGRLADNKLIVQGFDTAVELGPALDELNVEPKFDLVKKPGGFGPSDHASFYAKQLPVLHYFTGLHPDYHRPSDDTPRINLEGLERVSRYVAAMVERLANAEGRPTFQQSDQERPLGGGGDRPYFGSIPDFAQAQPGYALSGVTKGSPAEQGGLRGGDVIVRLGTSRIGNLEDFDSALRKFKGGDTVDVVVLRDGKELTLRVTLGAPR